MSVIALDARAARYYASHGIGTYTVELIRAMPSTALGHRLVSQTSRIRRRAPRPVPALANGALRGERFWRLAGSPAVLRGDEVLWHNPHNGLGLPSSRSLGLGLSRSRGGNRRQYPPGLVVTIHDLIPLVCPDEARSDYVRRFEQEVPAAASSAQAVITVSQHSRMDIVRLLGLPDNKVFVIPEAARTACRPMPKTMARAYLRAEYGLDHPFALYLGGFGQRKNVLALIEAFAQVRSRLPRHFTLVVAGAPDRTHGQAQQLVHRLGCAGAVVFPGHVGESDLAPLYSAATVFVYPSLYEGFGLPPLEAMACGCPVVCSDAASLPEVAGPGALLVNATEPQEIGAALALVANDDAAAGELGSRGLAWSARYSWEATAERTLEVYARVLQSTQSPAEGC